MRFMIFSLIAALCCTAINSAPSGDPKQGTCYLTVHVPVGASLEVNGQRTEQMTARRRFVSPPLPVGQTFYYTLTATYTQNGELVCKRRQVAVQAHAEVTLDMPSGETVPLPRSTPAASHTPFEAPQTEPPFSPPAKPTARQESARKPTETQGEPSRVEEPRPEPPKTEAPKSEPPKPETPKSEPPKPETPKAEPPPAPAPAKEPPKPTRGSERPEIEVPFVPTHPAVVAEMLRTAKVSKGDVVVDLGCGDGRIVIAAVKDFEAARGLGIDFDPERVQESRAAAKLAGVEDKVEFRQGDVLKLTAEDFKDVDVVTLYLLPEVNRKLKPVLQEGLKPGARIVSHDFDMGDDWRPEKTVHVLDPEGNEHIVYLWIIRGKK